MTVSDSPIGWDELGRLPLENLGALAVSTSEFSIAGAMTRLLRARDLVAAGDGIVGVDNLLHLPDVLEGSDKALAGRGGVDGACARAVSFVVLHGNQLDQGSVETSIR